METTTLVTKGGMTVRGERLPDHHGRHIVDATHYLALDGQWKELAYRGAYPGNVVADHQE